MPPGYTALWLSRRNSKLGRFRFKAKGCNSFHLPEIPRDRHPLNFDLVGIGQVSTHGPPVLSRKGRVQVFNEIAIDAPRRWNRFDFGMIGFDQGFGIAFADDCSLVNLP